MKRAAAVDDKHLAVTGLGQHRFDQQIVLIAANGADTPMKTRAAAQIPELDIADLERFLICIDQVRCRMAHKILP